MLGMQGDDKEVRMGRIHLGTRGVAAFVLLAISAIAITWGSTVSAASARTTPPCRPGDVEMIVAPGLAGLGHWSATLVLLDVGDRSCAFKGYPTVRVYTSNKHWVPAHRTPAGYLGGLGSGQHVMRVPLQFDTVASAILEGSDVPRGTATTCPTYLRIVVSLPGWPPSANLAFKEPGCSPLEVHPLVVGPTGDQPPQ
jgi:hypothetical protein